MTEKETNRIEFSSLFSNLLNLLQFLNKQNNSNYLY